MCQLWGKKGGAKIVIATLLFSVVFIISFRHPLAAAPLHLIPLSCIFVSLGGGAVLVMLFLIGV